MDDNKLAIIQELMEQLIEEMQPSKSDFEERLGRTPSKGVEVVKIEGDMPMEEAEEALGEDLDGDMEMGEDPEHAAMILGEEEQSPEDKLRERVLKMRG